MESIDFLNFKRNIVDAKVALPPITLSQFLSVNTLRYFLQISSSLFCAALIKLCEVVEYTAFGFVFATPIENKSKKK